VFIVGFERCSTTSLAAYLTSGGFARNLVDGVKEPGVFSIEPALAREIFVQRTADAPGVWHLDASVDYVLNEAAIAAITRNVEDYRIVVCMRNQFARTQSGYRMYRTVMSAAPTDANLTSQTGQLRFGSATLRRTAGEKSLTPAFLKGPVLGNYVYTAMMAKLRGIDRDGDGIARIDEAFERFLRRTLSEQIVAEFRHIRRNGGHFPEMSVLANSYFASWIPRLLQLVDPRKVAVVTLDDEGVRCRLHEAMCKFIGLDGGDVQFPHENMRSDREPIGERDLALARELMDQSLSGDSRQVVDLIGRTPALNTTLFAESALYWSQTGNV
jgi:hypothetical protein